jgi:hypothetical protein
MRKIPDVRNVAAPYFEILKVTLVERAKHRIFDLPICALVTFTPKAQIELSKPKIALMGLPWKSEEERLRRLKTFVGFVNLHVESFFLFGTSFGLTNSHADVEIPYVFVTIYMPGFESWTLAQTFAVVNGEIIFNEEYCTSDETVIEPTALSGLWPDEVGLS